MSNYNGALKRLSPAPNLNQSMFSFSYFFILKYHYFLALNNQRISIFSSLTSQNVRLIFFFNLIIFRESLVQVVRMKRLSQQL